ncbi:hypothetical protein Dsin_019553 [Dipteronia sinensis]|uniref:Uncharacterized protein n=1 Tax=Dipteronia sinensis TaxID=43782 RepID=A0AAE0A7Y7_9ROSI|nr:hypothetical protein Dsin_019553 [Dipteronia sinensis]
MSSHSRKRKMEAMESGGVSIFRADVDGPIFKEKEDTLGFLTSESISSAVGKINGSGPLLLLHYYGFGKFRSGLWVSINYQSGQVVAVHHLAGDRSVKAVAAHEGLGFPWLILLWATL